MTKTLSAFIRSYLFVLFFAVFFSVSIAITIIGYLQAHVSEDFRISTLLASVGGPISRLDDTIEFADQKGTDYIISHLNESFETERFSIRNQSPSCSLMTEEIGHFQVCWNFFDIRPIAFKKVGHVSAERYLVIESRDTTVLPIFKAIWIAIASLVLIGVGALALFYFKIKKAILAPLVELHNSLQDEVSKTSRFEIAEFQDLSQAIEEYKDQIKLRIRASALRLITHDVKGPLAAVIRFSNRIRSLSSEEIKSYVRDQEDFLVELQSRVSGLLSDLRDLNDGELKKTSFEIGNLIQSVIKSVQVDVDVLGSALTLKIRADAGKLHRVLSNILENAKYEREKNQAVRIWVEVEQRDRDLSIEVGNTGSYIEPDVMPHLFDEFLTVGKPRGTGLGLSIARKFIESHGGTINCESIRTSEESRVVFMMKVPLESEQAKENPYVATTLGG